MARAPDTGYYFEPITERLALVVEGSPFPSDDHWAWIGDPIEMTAELAKLEVALRWPGVDPDDLELELDTTWEIAQAEADLAAFELPEAAREPQEFDFGVDAILAQAEALQRAASETVSLPNTVASLEAAAEEVAARDAGAEESADAAETGASAEGQQAADDGEGAAADAEDAAPRIELRVREGFGRGVRIRVGAPSAEDAQDGVAPSRAADADEP